MSETVGTAAPVVYAYDPAGRLVSRGADTYGFDADGNLVQSLEQGIETRSIWSAANRLVRVERGSFTEEYSYLPEDWRRLTRTANGKTFFTVFDNADALLRLKCRVIPGWGCFRVSEDLCDAASEVARPYQRR